MATTRTENGPPKRSRSAGGSVSLCGPLRKRDRSMSRNPKQPTTSVVSDKVAALPMSRNPRQPNLPVIPSKGPTPVRVRLRRVTASRAIAYPPDGEGREWWQRLKGALATSSSHFVDTSLQQLIAAARLPCSGISETAVNASLAFIEGAKPQGEVECALVIQMACAHTAAMAVLARIGGAHGGDRSVTAMASSAARLLRAYAAQVEVLRRLRSGGSQLVRVEHVHVNEGGQAVIGNVKPAPNSPADDASWS
jgi:hypothetical protein